jgi:hypothetical protein
VSKGIRRSPYPDESQHTQDPAVATLRPARFVSEA